MDHNPAKPERESRRFPSNRYPLRSLTERIIAAGFVVQRAFGYGFFESVYRRALAVELRYMGIAVSEEVPYELFHRGVSVGFYRADLVVDSRVMVESKTGLVLDPIAPVQLRNCLGAAGPSLGLVMHFGPSVIVKRVIASPGRHRGGR